MNKLTTDTLAAETDEDGFESLIGALGVAVSMEVMTARTPDEAVVVWLARLLHAREVMQSMTQEEIADFVLPIWHEAAHNVPEAAQVDRVRQKMRQAIRREESRGEKQKKRGALQ